MTINALKTEEVYDLADKIECHQGIKGVLYCVCKR